MIDVSFLSGKRVSVFGLGKAGMATLKALSASGISTVAYDDNASSLDALAAAPLPHVTVQKVEAWDYAHLSYVILSPGVPFTHPEPHRVVTLAQQASVPVVCDIELLYLSKPHTPFIGITGTNGKSTTTSLIAHILKESGMPVEVGGNLGYPVLGFNALPEKGAYVIETSSYQLDLLEQTHFHISVFLNITPDHLDRHGDIEGYIKAKKRIFTRQGKNDVAVIAVDDAHTQKLFRELSDAGAVGKVVAVSAEKPVAQGVYVGGGVIHDTTGAAEARYTVGALPYLPGKHNAQNIAAAYAATRAMGITAETIVQAIRSFRGLPHRVQLVAEKDGILFVNDSKATNADAAAKALESYEHIFWIAGGKPKEGGIAPLEPLFPRITHAFLLGAAEEEFAKTLEGKLPYTRCGNLENAFNAAAALAKKQKGTKKPVVLLSPACASFDQWPNFEVRGEAFCGMVKAWKG